MAVQHGRDAGVIVRTYGVGRMGLGRRWVVILLARTITLSFGPLQAILITRTGSRRTALVMLFFRHLLLALATAGHGQSVPER